MSDVVVADRPTPGEPRPYLFPAFERHTLSNGLTVITVPLPGRPLVSATLLLPNGAVDEPPATAGATVLAARALPEGTEHYDAVAFVEASERLGASIHAEAGWDGMSAGVEVPAERLEPSLELLAEMVGRPTFPAPEVERLREERLNDILQARADPRRRADEAFVGTIYSADSPYHRPAAGTRETVAPLGPADCRRAWERGMDPTRTTIVVGGDLAGLDVLAMAERLFGGWRPAPGVADQHPIVALPARESRIVRIVHRPGSVQTEIRIGHTGLARRIPDYHALCVMSAILGGLFNSRLNRNLREDKGYTYGAGASFDLRRAAGPFAARAAVNTEVTVPAIREMLTELERMRAEPVADAELRAGRDYLVGVFPLRFETPGPVVGSISGLVVYGLPDDELGRYRAGIEAVTRDDVLAAARAHIQPERMAVVLVGDVDRIASDVEAAGFGPVEVERDDRTGSD
jgi:zinc protease